MSMQLLTIEKRSVIMSMRIAIIKLRMKFFICGHEFCQLVR
jgi:hypothetical protein